MVKVSEAKEGKKAFKWKDLASVKRLVLLFGKNRDSGNLGERR